MNYYEILGVSRTASAEEIKAAYVRLARENHPDRFRDPAERERAAARFQEINESYNHLKDEKQRQEYDRSLQRKARTPQQEAELFYKNGVLRERVKEYGEALQMFYEAMRLDPEQAHYIAAAARVTAVDPGKARQAAELYEKALAKDPLALEPYLELGALLARSGLVLRARRVYEAGLQKHPGEAALKERLAALASAERAGGKK
jgi:curved DNA-binding protein CbpA